MGSDEYISSVRSRGTLYLNWQTTSGLTALIGLFFRAGCKNTGLWYMCGV